MLVDISQRPPALSQSAFVLNCEKSVDVPLPVEGLAEGEVVDGVLEGPELEVPELPALPLGVPLSEVPDEPPGLVLVP